MGVGGRRVEGGPAAHTQGSGQGPARLIISAAEGDPGGADTGGGDRIKGGGCLLGGVCHDADIVRKLDIAGGPVSEG